jgi:hypothetical protein
MNRAPTPPVFEANPVVLALGSAQPHCKRVNTKPAVADHNMVGRVTETRGRVPVIRWPGRKRVIQRFHTRTIAEATPHRVRFARPVHRVATLRNLPARFPGDRNTPAKARRAV